VAAIILRWLLDFLKICGPLHVCVCVCAYIYIKINIYIYMCVCVCIIGNAQTRAKGQIRTV
jgi:hypothetical protein